MKKKAENADSRNKVEKKQIPVKEAVSPLARIEDEEDEEEEGMKLRRRSKIKVTVLSFDLALFCTCLALYRFNLLAIFVPGFNRESTSHRNG